MPVKQRRDQPLRFSDISVRILYEPQIFDPVGFVYFSPDVGRHVAADNFYIQAGRTGKHLVEKPRQTLCVFFSSPGAVHYKIVLGNDRLVIGAQQQFVEIQRYVMRLHAVNIPNERFVLGAVAKYQRRGFV